MNKKDFINKVFITKSPEETQKLGYNFAKILKKRDLICLYGDLGSGKTTFVQGLAKGLGIKNKILSPTFIIVRTYKNFHHIDLYRVEKEDDIKALGIEEFISDKNNIIAIEWAEKARSFLPDKRIDIKFSYEKNDTRKVEFSLTT